MYINKNLHFSKYKKNNKTDIFIFIFRNRIHISYYKVMKNNKQSLFNKLKKFLSIAFNNWQQGGIKKQ